MSKFMALSRSGSLNTSRTLRLTSKASFLILGYTSSTTLTSLPLSEKAFCISTNCLVNNSKGFEISIDAIENNNTTKNLLAFFFLLTSNVFLFDYVRTKSSMLESFIDEYLVLASNSNFFTTLDFNAGSFVGGSYSTYLTSGPLSSVGGVILWELSNNFRLSRIGNFYWVILLQIFLSIYFFKVHKVGIRFITIANIFIISLIPWWQGSLYSIGEIPSMILFVNALFLFNHRRRLSIILISFSIIYGKILTLLPFIGFYIFVVIKEKKLISILKDFGYFLLPILSWFLLIQLNYEGGSIVNYINDQYVFISQHPSSGANLNIIYTFWDSINNSEVSIWNIYDIIRIGIVPIIYFIYILLRQDKINYFFNNLSFFLLGSTFLPYIWFWFLSETKWMRYSQHFTVIILISLFYFLSSNIFTNRADLLTIGFLILIFIENYKLL